MERLKKEIIKARKAIPKLRDATSKLMPDILAATGAISISYGAYLFMPPLGFISMGIMLIAGAVILTFAKAQD